MYNDEQIRRVIATVAAGTTDAVLCPAESGRKLRILQCYALTTAATALTINTKPSGSGVAISPVFTSAAGVPTIDWTYSPAGWLDSLHGEGLTVTTGAGQSHSIVAVIASLPSLDGVLGELGLALLLEDGLPLLAESA